MCHCVQFISTVLAEVCAFREVLPQKAVCIFIAPALPRALRVAEIDIDPCLRLELFVLRHFGALIPGQRFAHVFWQVLNGSCNCVPNRFGTMSSQSRTVFLARTITVTWLWWQVQQKGETGFTFDKRADG